jgi:hypothetical protein
MISMLSDLLFRLRAIFRAKSMDAGLDEELQFHLDRQLEKPGKPRSRIKPESAPDQGRHTRGDPVDVERGAQRRDPASFDAPRSCSRHNSELCLG